MRGGRVGGNGDLVEVERDAILTRCFSQGASNGGTTLCIGKFPGHVGVAIHAAFRDLRVKEKGAPHKFNVQGGPHRRRRLQTPPAQITPGTDDIRHHVDDQIGRGGFGHLGFPRFSDAS